MIKARISDGSLIFGLSKINLEKLQQGQPIMINLKDLGQAEQKIFIVYGETEEKIIEDLPFNIDPDKTKFHY